MIRVGHGIGKKLLTAHQELLQTPEHDLFLLTSHYKTPAQAFYERQVYQRIGAIPSCILSDDANRIDYKKLPR